MQRACGFRRRQPEQRAELLSSVLQLQQHAVEFELEPPVPPFLLKDNKISFTHI